MNATDTLEEPQGFKRFLLSLSRLQFFSVSLVVHLGIVLLFGSITLFRYVSSPPEFVGEGESFVVNTAEPPGPPAPEAPEMESMAASAIPEPGAPSLSAITAVSPA